MSTNINQPDTGGSSGYRAWQVISQNNRLHYSRASNRPGAKDRAVKCQNIANYRIYFDKYPG